MGKSALPTADGHPGIQGGQGCVVEWDDAFSVELAERDLEPGAVSGQVPQTVEFEVEQFPNPDAGAAQQHDGAASGDVGEPVDGSHQRCVDVGMWFPQDRGGFLRPLLGRVRLARS